jgi:hypothetical protein
MWEVHLNMSRQLDMMISELPGTNSAMTAMIAEDRWRFACGRRQGTVTIIAGNLRIGKHTRMKLETP